MTVSSLVVSNRAFSPRLWKEIAGTTDLIP